MNRFVTPRRVFFAAAATLLLAASAHAQEPQSPEPKAGPAQAAETPRQAPAAPASAETSAPAVGDRAPASETRLRPLSPMMTEMQAVLALEAEKLAELRQRGRESATPDGALAVQREIERLKFETEIALLRVQARHARAAGRVEVATRIEVAIADLVNPPRPLAPAARPVPNREATQR